ncbi:MAG TPA: glycosyltransferase [Terriglobales bacterium]|nr:glycosyltransferase [Terriglobales bacterium]
MSREARLVSVIIPALNEEKVIGKCLEALVRQQLPRDLFEVIVVDNGSVDETLKVVRRFDDRLNLTIRTQPRCHISEVRNAGAREAQGKFLAFLDADCIAPSNWLQSAVSMLQSAGDMVLGSFCSIPENSGWVPRAWYGDMVKERRGPVSYVPSATFFISSKAFRSLGGFDADLETSEDFELCQRAKAAGYPVIAHSGLSTVHLGTVQTLSAFWQKERWHGNGVRSVLLRRSSQRGFMSTVLLTIYSLLSMTLTVLAIPAAIATGRVALLAVGPILLAGGAALMAARAAIRRRRWKYFFPHAALYVVYGTARTFALLGLGGKTDRRLEGSAQPLSDRRANVGREAA